MIRAIAASLMVSTLLPALHGQNRLNMITGFDHSPDMSAVEWMERETAGLFSQAGLALSWQKFSDVRATDLPVWVQFHGNCRIEPGALLPPTDGPLASTKVRDGEIQPFIEVDCARTAAMVWQNRGTIPVPLVTRT